MDDETTNKTGDADDGGKKNWRERLGINKELPKIAAEFRDEKRVQPKAPVERPAEPRPEPRVETRAEPRVAVAAHSGTGRPVASPAPMAPRPSAGAQRTADQAGGPRQMPRVSVRPASERPAAERPVVRTGEQAPVQRPAVSREPEVRSTEVRGTEVRSTEERSTARPSAEDFSARLRAQREAAERLAQQRQAVSRSIAAGSSGEPVARSPEQKTQQPPAAHDEHAHDGFRPAQPAATNGGGSSDEIEASRPKFTFAPEELAHYEDEISHDAASGGHVAEAPAPNSPPLMAPPQPRQTAPQPEATVSRPGPGGREAPGGAVAAGYNPPPRMHQAPAPEGYSPAPRPYDNAPVLQPGPRTAPAEPGLGHARLDAPQRSGQPGAAPPLRAPSPEARAPLQAETRPIRPAEYSDNELEDVFEDDRRGRAVPPRASADDYNAAYREYDDVFEDQEDDEDRRSRSGPMILVLALLTVAAIAGALVYFYRAGSTSGTATGDGQVPVITAPQEPVKTEPDQADQPVSPAQPVRRKQIYDRILGEETVESETMMPSEEAPVPQAQPQDQDALSTPVPNVQDDTATQPSGSELEPLPLPLPPPPGSSDQQGSLDTPSGQRTAAQPTGESTAVEPTGAVASTKSSRTGLADAKSDADTAANQTVIAALPPPEPETDAAGAVAPATGASEPAAETVQTPAPTTTAIDNLPNPPLPRSKPAQRIASVTQPVVQPAPTPSTTPQTSVPSTFTATQNSTSGSTGPISLQPQTATQPQIATQPATIAAAPQPAPAPEPAESSGGFSLPGFFQSSDDSASARSTGRLADDDPLAGQRTSINSGSGTSATLSQDQLSALQPQQVQPVQPQPQQVQPQATQPALQPAPSILPPSQSQPQATAPVTQPATQPSQPADTSGGSGYVVQFASFRSEADAQNEYQRLRSQHGGILGNLAPRIQRAELGALGTFYRLGVGPLGSKQAATNLCNSLIASGEKDCLVRRQ